MGKAPSDKTLLKHLKREYNIISDKERNLASLVEMYRARAEKAEQEVAEWKTRFDTLLRRDEVKT